MFTAYFKKLQEQRESFVDAEIAKNRASLEAKRLKAIEILGDKWIMKGGAYNRNTFILNDKLRK